MRKLSNNQVKSVACECLLNVVNSKLAGNMPNIVKLEKAYKKSFQKVVMKRNEQLY